MYFYLALPQITQLDNLTDDQDRWKSMTLDEVLYLLEVEMNVDLIFTREFTVVTEF